MDVGEGARNAGRGELKTGSGGEEGVTGCVGLAWNLFWKGGGLETVGEVGGERRTPNWGEV
jgi:hypothetical protein